VLSEHHFVDTVAWGVGCMLVAMHAMSVLWVLGPGASYCATLLIFWWLLKTGLYKRLLVRY
jgi:hypothetical protein